MAIQLGSAYGKVNIDSSGVQSGVNSAIGSLDTLGQAAKKIGGDMQKIGAAMTLGLTVPIVAFFKSSVTSANEAQNAMAEVNAVLKSTGGIAGMTAEDVEKLASDFQKLTKFSDEQILSGESMLLTFTKISKDVFPQATEAMLNMAEKFGSVENASVQLGKALNDPIAGVSALRRVGVMLTDQQEEQIKKFMAVNDIASAQKVILQELEVEFGGLAKAAGATDEGKFVRFMNTLDDVKELIGSDLKKIIMPFIESMTALMQSFLDMPEPARQAIIKIVIALGGLAALSGPLIFLIGTFVSFIGSIMSTISFLGSMGITVGGVSAAVSTAGSMLYAFGAAALSALGSILLLAAGPVILYLAFKNNFMGITDTAKQLWFIIKFYFAEGWKWLANAVKGGGTIVMNYFKQMVERVVASFRNIKWSEIGRNMIMGIVNGLLGGIPAIVSAAARAGQAALEAMRKALDSHSPSRKFMKLGIDSGDGYKLGLKNSVDPNLISKAMAKPVQQMTTAQNNRYQINMANGLTLRDVDEMMNRKIEKFTLQLNGALGGQ